MGEAKKMHNDTFRHIFFFNFITRIYFDPDKYGLLQFSNFKLILSKIAKNPHF